MGKEIRILRAFLEKRTIYEKYAPYVIGLQNLDRNMGIVLNFIKMFYDKYTQVTTIPEVDFKLYIKTADKFGFLKSNPEYINDIYKMTLDNQGLTLDVVEGCVEQHVMARVLDKAALVLDNNQSGILSTVQDDIDEYHKVLRNPPQNMVEYKLDLDSLIKDEITKPGIPFCNTRPNQDIRGMREGQLGLIYAYVGTGKTSYGVSNLCSVAKYLHINQINRPGIYCGNEEDIRRVSLRTIQCMTNWNNLEIERNKKLVPGILAQNGFGKLKFIDHVTTMSIFEKILAKHNPRVVFIDQGSNVKVGGTKKGGVDALEEVFTTFRDLSKRYKCTIISMIQGGDECFDKKYPTLKDIYGSKSAIQGTLDWAISLGRNTTDSNYAMLRYFNITKNKGHIGKYACKFDEDRCQFKEVK